MLGRPRAAGPALGSDVERLPGCCGASRAPEAHETGTRREAHHDPEGERQLVRHAGPALFAATLTRGTRRCTAATRRSQWRETGCEPPGFSRLRAARRARTIAGIDRSRAMMRSLWISKTGMEAQQTQLDNISNNLANVSTNGYKRSHAVFEDLMYQNLRQAGACEQRPDRRCRPACSSASARAPSPPRATSARATCSRRAIRSISRSSGNGFFQVQMPDGTTAYTRDGSFQVSATGPARHQHRLHGAARHHDPGRRAERDDRQRRHGLGRRCPARRRRRRSASCSSPNFINPAGLEPKGGNLYAETTASGTPTPATPAPTAWARCSRASSRPRTSTSSRSSCR